MAPAIGASTAVRERAVGKMVENLLSKSVIDLVLKDTHDCQGSSLSCVTLIRQSVISVMI